jgi:hypothetical protein
LSPESVAGIALLETAVPERAPSGHASGLSPLIRSGHPRGGAGDPVLTIARIDAGSCCGTELTSRARGTGEGEAGLELN